jgi:hypothetical protein
MKVVLFYTSHSNVFKVLTVDKPADFRAALSLQTGREKRSFSKNESE